MSVEEQRARLDDGGEGDEARRAAYRRASEPQGAGAYLLGWLFLILWGCWLVISFPDRAMRWLLLGSNSARRPRRHPASDAVDAVDAVTGDVGVAAAPPEPGEPADASGIDGDGDGDGETDDADDRVPSVLDAASEPTDSEPTEHQPADREPDSRPDAAVLVEVPHFAIPGASRTDAPLLMPLPPGLDEPASTLDAGERAASDGVALHADAFEDEPAAASGDTVSGPWYRRPGVWVALVYLQLLVIAELAVAAAGAAGLVAHGLLVLALLVHQWRTRDAARAGLLIALTLPSLHRAAGFAAAEAQLDPEWGYALESAALLVAAWLLARRGGLSLASAGLARWDAWGLFQQVAIGVLGLPLGIAAFLLLHPGPLVPGRAADGVLLATALLGLAAVAREMVFRGIAQGAAARALGAGPAIAGVALAVAVLDLGQPPIVELPFTLAVGLLFGWLAYRTRSVLGVSLAHATMSIVLLVLAPLAIVPVPDGLSWIGMPPSAMEAVPTPVIPAAANRAAVPPVR